MIADTLLMQMITFNVCAMLPDSHRELIHLFNGQDKMADIVVVGLQEVILTGFGRRLGGLFKKRDINDDLKVWEGFIIKALNQINELKSITDKDE